MRVTKAFTFLEVIIGFAIITVLFLPVFFALTSTLQDTERCYAEITAIAHGKFVMDTVLFQIPWRCIHEGNPCIFSDPKNVGTVVSLLQSIVPKMFPDGGAGGMLVGDGILTDVRGYQYRTRLKCIDLDNVFLSFGGETFLPNKITGKDADGKYNLMKKLILQIKWSLRKGTDPKTDPNSKSLFLVAIKSDLER
ncbi:MAG: hypothetical protein HQM08_04180 [Candidatus Riflebacteria bacterium]|nr:hypothetical protein [Candidatus Riflebacteria bacterium]